MNKLLKANFYKLLKEKSIYVLAGVSMIISLISIIIYKIMANMSLEGVTLSDFANAESLFLAGAQLSQNAGMIMALGIAIYVGREFSQNTVRNKIVVGYSKTKIYLSNLIVSIAIGVILYLAYEFVVFSVALPLFGWGKAFVFGDFIRQLINSLLILIAMSAAVNMVSMLTRNIVAGIIANMIGIIAIPAILAGINMIPVKGAAKTFIEIVTKSNFLGQSALIATENSVSFMVWVIVSTIIMTLGTAVLGSYLFEKMDVK